LPFFFLPYFCISSLGDFACRPLLIPWIKREDILPLGASLSSSNSVEMLSAFHALSSQIFVLTWPSSSSLAKFDSPSQEESFNFPSFLPLPLLCHLFFCQCPLLFPFLFSAYFPARLFPFVFLLSRRLVPCLVLPHPILCAGRNCSAPLSDLTSHLRGFFPVLIVGQRVFPPARTFIFDPVEYITDLNTSR